MTSKEPITAVDGAVEHSSGASRLQEWIRTWWAVILGAAF